MIRIARGNSDAIIDQIVGAFRKYEIDHPQSEIDVYRQNSVSVRVRIVDPGFSGRSKSQRSEAAWKYLDTIPDDIQSEISTLLLLAPSEKQKSLANLEFEDPQPSNL